MKTFLLTSVKRLKNYSKTLDAEAILYNKSWTVFNETGDKELMIFRPNKELLISRKGIIQKGKWDLLDIANIIIDMGDRTYLFNASYVEDGLLALRLDGTEEYMVMIDPEMKERLLLNSVQSIEAYLDNRYKRILADIADKEFVKAKSAPEAVENKESEADRKKRDDRNTLIAFLIAGVLLLIALLSVFFK